MKVTFSQLVITAGICGILSFAFLATSIGTDYWYIIEINAMNTTDFENMSSHSGLWSITEGEKSSVFMDSFSADYSRYSASEQRMLNMHGAIVVLLPLSLVLVLFGGICGLVSSLARSPVLLTAAASYFFICSVLTVCGASLYVVYSSQAEALAGPESLAFVRTSFGWSFALAWLSYGLELLTGALLLAAAQLIRRRQSRPTRA
ncbi:transmembrane protein 235 [Salarias fasciatus]|uniref:transmembrane protein 235 n=1 Tax=Salarias fasciatus TaxID=181472 RepID=UPI001176FEE8|nr:transmembrane protein 235-like [Salarias fasciatus]